MKEQAYIPDRWEDIVFENRNRDYGAYSMRKIYPGHVAKAVLIMLAILGFVFAYPSIVKFFKPKEEEKLMKQVNNLTVNLEQPPPIMPDEVKPPKIDIPPPVKTIIKFLPPKVTDKVVVEEVMPTIEEIKKNDTGTENVEGTGEVVFEEPVKEVVEEGEDPNAVFMVVEQMPEYPGGLKAMYEFVGNNMKYPAQARRMGIEGTVFTSFVVDADGTLTDLKIVKGVGSGIDEEALRVIKKMPPWKPGKQRGRPVKVRFVLPLRFKLGDE